MTRLAAALSLLKCIMDWAFKFIAKRTMDLVVPGSGLAWDAYDAGQAAYGAANAAVHGQFAKAAGYAAGGFVGYQADFNDNEIAEDIQTASDWAGTAAGIVRKAPGMITRVERGRW